MQWWRIKSALLAFISALLQGGECCKSSQDSQLIYSSCVHFYDLFFLWHDERPQYVTKMMYTTQYPQYFVPTFELSVARLATDMWTAQRDCGWFNVGWVISVKMSLLSVDSLCRYCMIIGSSAGWGGCENMMRNLDRLMQARLHQFLHVHREDNVVSRCDIRRIWRICEWT